jgi:hypothetical protein
LEYPNLQDNEHTDRQADPMAGTAGAADVSLIVLAVILIYAFPGIITWLPMRMIA